MMKTRAFAALLLVTACSAAPQNAYRNPGNPNELLSVAAEAVNISLTDARAMDQLTQWMSREQPSRAALYCDDAAPECAEARKALRQFNVPFQQRSDGRNIVSLHYERVQERDCKHSYTDNSTDNQLLHHPAFGCSVASNMVGHVADKRQFVNPSLLDFQDGEKAAQVYRNYMNNNSSSEGDADTSGGLLEAE
jgi:type IV pilus biogenesis protein CpaD/CtpE